MSENPTDDESLRADLDSILSGADNVGPTAADQTPNFFSPTFDRAIKDGTVDDMSWSSSLKDLTRQSEEAAKVSSGGLVSSLFGRYSQEESKGLLSQRQSDLDARREDLANPGAVGQFFGSINRNLPTVKSIPQILGMGPGTEDELRAEVKQKHDLQQKAIDAARAMPNYEAQGYWGDKFERFGQSAAQMAGLIIEGMGTGVGAVGSTLGIDTSSQYNAIEAAGEYIIAKSKELFPGDVARQEEFGAAVAQGLGSYAGLLGVSAPALLLKMSAPAQLVILGTLGALATGSETHSDAEASIKAGRKVEDWQRLAAYGLGLGIGFTEALPILYNAPGLSFKAKSAIGASLASIAREFGEESGQEGLQTFLQNFTAWLLHNPDRGLWEGVSEAMLIGGLTGGSVQAGKLAFSSSARAGAIKEAAPGGATAPAPAAPAQAPKPFSVDLDQYDNPNIPSPQAPPVEPGTPMDPAAAPEFAGSARPVWPMAGPGAVAPTPPVPTYNDILDALYQSGQVDDNGDPDGVAFQDTLEALTGKRFWSQLNDVEKSSALQVALGADPGTIQTGTAPAAAEAPAAPQRVAMPAAQPVSQPDSAGGPGAQGVPAAPADQRSGKPVNQPDKAAGQQAAKPDAGTEAVEALRQAGIPEQEIERAGIRNVFTPTSLDPETRRAMDDLDVALEVDVVDDDGASTKTPVTMPATQALTMVDRRLKGMAALMRCLAA